MFIDFGFIRYISKDILKFIGVVWLVISPALAIKLASHWGAWIFAGSLLAWFGFMVIKLVYGHFKDRYADYCAEKDKMWNTLKK